MDRRIIALISAAALLAALVIIVVVARGGSDSVDLTDTSKRPKIERSDEPAPTELVVNDIVEGEGPPAKKGDELTVQYVGALYDTGEEFDASWNTGQPFPVTLGGGTVIKGWDQGLEGMKAGGRREIIIPPDLGYGPQGQPPTIPGNATLVFIVDLLSIN